MLLKSAPPDSSLARDLKRELGAARAQTDLLFQMIGPAGIYVRPLPPRHRLIFYLGHLEAFDWNQLGSYGLHRSQLHPTFDGLFERGIDPEPGQLPSDVPSDWPSLEEVRAYVGLARRRVDALWDQASPTVQQTLIEHRWMHAETLAYLLHNLPHEQKRRPAGVSPVPPHAEKIENRMIPIPGGIATLGRPRDSGFGWDNEFSETPVDVPAFSISRFKVTNGDYLQFVNEGHPAPYFWTRIDDRWYYRGMFEMVELPLNAPVYVTHEQAAAYARSRRAALPTEAQFHRAAYGTPHDGEQQAPWGDSPVVPPLHGNFDFQHWDPVSVTEYPAGASAFGVGQLIGNGWEWTSTPFAPFPGFRPAENYPGYSADFFDGKHFVMKGASPQTAALLTRRSLRNWFRPDYPYVYAAFRLVQP